MIGIVEGVKGARRIVRIGIFIGMKLLMKRVLYMRLGAGLMGWGARNLKFVRLVNLGLGVKLLNHIGSIQSQTTAQ